jgi:hypothetical protein
MPVPSGGISGRSFNSCCQQEKNGISILLGILQSISYKFTAPMRRTNKRKVISDGTVTAESEDDRALEYERWRGRVGWGYVEEGAGRRSYLMVNVVGLATGVLVLEVIQLFKETAG